MEFSEIKIYKIDIDLAIVESIEHDELSRDFLTYLNGIVQQVTTGESGRKFRFEREHTEVRQQISRIMNDEDFVNISSEIANRLLQCELSIQARMERMSIVIQKGIVVQAIFTENGIRKFFICKSDHSDFLNETNFNISRGLPIKKKIFKAFVCSLLENNTLDNVLVFDINQTPAQYWWKDFLELSKIYSDEDNTENAFNAIDKKVLTKYKDDFPQDYMYMRNSTVRYFRANEFFNMENYLDTAIGDYEPYDRNFNVIELKEKVRALPSRSTYPFDNQFTIIRSKIKARFLKKIPLTDQIELHLIADVPNIERIITAEEGEDGNRYVKIKSDRGYEYFRNLHRNQ